MTDHPRNEPRQPSLDDFFARERAEAPVLQPDESRWQRIVAEARTHQVPWGRYLLGAAAVVVLAAALGWGLLRTGPGPGPGLPAPASSTPATGSTTQPTPPPTSGSSSSRTTSPSAAVLPVPASFRLHSLTTADNRHLFALGTVSCPGGSCPALAASSDDGGTWRLVHTFPASAATGGVPPGEPAGAGRLSDVRFASPSIGWVFGGAAMRTTDGGRTWQDYPHPGGDVIDLETDGRDVVLTAAPSCSAGSCRGPISVVRAPVSAAGATDVVGTIDGGTVVSGAAITWHAGRAYVSPVVQPRPGAAPVGPVVVRPDGLHPAGPQGCGNGEGSQLVAPAAGTTLFAVCPSSGAAGHVGYAIESSADGGATWQRVSVDRLVLVNAGHESFAGADDSRLLAVSGGSPDVHGSMAVSTDGGATWAPPAGAPSLPAKGWAWVGAVGGPVYYALSADPVGGYWRSEDGGQTWAPVQVAGS